MTRGFLTIRSLRAPARAFRFSPTTGSDSPSRATGARHGALSGALQKLTVAPKRGMSGSIVSRSRRTRPVAGLTLSISL